MKLRIVGLALLVAGLTLTFGASSAAPASGGSTGGSGCIAHHPNYIEDVFEVQYTAGCSGHDEPELDPVSSLPGSAKDMTWTVVLPSNGSRNVDATGPTFWFGGTVTDPNSLFGQAFYELQFYPNGVTTNCTPNGGFELKHVQGAYTACSPVWSIHATGQKPVLHEPAAFNAMLTNGTPNTPLVMHAGDTVTVHVLQTAANDGVHLIVTDLTPAHAGSGTIVLNSKKDGPLNEAFDTQQIGNALGWGLVNDTPNSFVWEIGHTSPFSSPHSQFCIPGETICDSFDAPAWAGTLPIQIKSVTFGNGSQASEWATVSDTGGKAEVLGNSFVGPTDCSGYGGPFCIYPNFTLGSSGLHYGVDYPDEVDNLGGVDQFAQTMECGGPFGPNSTYCDTPVLP